MYGVNMWFTSPDTELRTIEELAEGEGNIGEVILKGGYKYSLHRWRLNFPRVFPFYF